MRRTSRNHAAGFKARVAIAAQSRVTRHLLNLMCIRIRFQNGSSSYSNLQSMYSGVIQEQRSPSLISRYSTPRLHNSRWWRRALVEAGLVSEWTDGGVHGNFHTYKQGDAVLLIGGSVTTDIAYWRARQASNPRPLGSKPSTLSNWTTGALFTSYIVILTCAVKCNVCQLLQPSSLSWITE